MAGEELDSIYTAEAKLPDKLNAIKLVRSTIRVWQPKIMSYALIIAIIVGFSIIEAVIISTMFGFLLPIPTTDPFSFIWGVIIVLLLYPNPSTLLVFIMLPGILTLISFLLSALVIGASIRFAFKDYGGGVASVRESLAFSASRIFRLAGLQLVLSSIGAILLIPSLNLRLSGFQISLYTFGLMLVLGFVYLAILTKLVLVYVVSIVEDLTVMDSIRRAFDLTKGRFLYVLINLIVLHIAVIVVGLLIDIIAASVGGLAGPLGYELGLLISSLVTTPLLYVFQVVLYRDLVSEIPETNQYW